MKLPIIVISFLIIGCQFEDVSSEKQLPSETIQVYFENASSAYIVGDSHGWTIRLVNDSSLARYRPLWCAYNYTIDELFEESSRFNKIIDNMSKEFPPIRILADHIEVKISYDN